MCWNCLFKLLKYHCYRETYTFHGVLDNRCYNSNSSLSIRKYVNGSFMLEEFKGASALRRKNNFFDREIDEYKHVLNQICVVPVCFFLKLLFDGLSYDIKSQYQIDLAIFCSLFVEFALASISVSILWEDVS